MDKAAQAKAQGMVGLLTRCGQAVFGEDGCLAAIRSQKAALLLLDAGASANARKRYSDSCATYGVPLFILPEGMIGQCTGKPGRIALAAQKSGLSQQLLTLLSDQSE